MKHLPVRDRPREKLARAGSSALGDAELLAAILGSGTRQHDSSAMAEVILDRCGGLHGLVTTTDADLCAIPGMGPARAARILAALELGRRTLRREPSERALLGTPRQVAAYLLPEYGARPVEQFGIVLLDAKHRLLRTVVLTVGTLDCSVVHPREVFREAASARAAGIVLFHNHPSSDPSPSGEDIALTRRFVEAGTLMGIEVLDHVILTATRYCSLRETGLLGSGTIRRS